MRIVLATYGSRGDVQPTLALAKALGSAGHDVLLVGPPERAAWAIELGCSYQPFGRDVTAFIDGLKNAHSLVPAIEFLKFVRYETISQFSSLPDIIKGADLVIGVSLMFGLASIAESMNIPYRYLAFTPQLLKSGFHPPFVLKYQGLPMWYNRAAWSVITLLDKFNLTRLINIERKKIGLRSVIDAWTNILGENMIVASDPVVAVVPSDAGIAYTQTGYLHLDQPEKDNPELEEFLASGPSPVYAGFGSMPKADQISNIPMMVKAVRDACQRLIIAKFWDDPSECSSSNDIFFIKGYPHMKLFPRMAAVIHHGGAGTTASCAASGIPQIVVPHVLDQYYWGHKVYKAHLGAKPIWRSKISAKKITAAIDECLSSNLIIETTKRAVKEIDVKKSLENAVKNIEKGFFMP